MDVEKKIGLKSPKLHTQGPPGTCQGGLREYARSPKTAKSRGILILRMGPGDRRPSPSTENQITPTSGLVNRQVNHLLQNLVALPQSCEGPSECNKATRLGLRCEGMPLQCNGGLFTQRQVDPQSPKDGRQLACPTLTGKV